MFPNELCDGLSDELRDGWFLSGVTLEPDPVKLLIVGVIDTGRHDHFVTFHSSSSIVALVHAVIGK